MADARRGRGKAEAGTKQPFKAGAGGAWIGYVWPIEGVFPMDFQSIEYAVSGRRATITLNRPARMNAIDRHMPREIADAVAAANEDNNGQRIVLQGPGKGFCG